MRLAAGRGPCSASLVSFAESSFFPIPPDVMLVPITFVKRARAWVYAALATGSSVSVGVFGYAIGFFLFKGVGVPILAFCNGTDEFAAITQLFADYSVWILIIKGMTPIPLSS